MRLISLWNSPNISQPILLHVSDLIDHPVEYPLHSNNVRNEIESNPDLFFRTRLKDLHFATVRKAASLVGADPDNLVLCANVTSALNDVLKSIRLKPEDQGRPSVLS